MSLEIEEEDSIDLNSIPLNIPLEAILLDTTFNAPPRTVAELMATAEEAYGKSDFVQFHTAIWELSEGLRRYNNHYNKTQQLKRELANHAKQAKF